MSICEELNNYFEELKNLKLGLVSEMQIAKRGSGYLKVVELKIEILDRVKSLQEKINLDQLRLRDTIARQNGYINIGKFVDGMAWVTKDGEYCYIDKTGKEMPIGRFDYARNFSEGLAAVSKDGEYFYIDKIGKEIIGRFDNVGDFSEGLARVKKDGKWFYIDKNGHRVSP